MEIEIFKKKRKKLLFFGSKHGININQIKLIKREILRFEPETILVESGFDKISYSSEKEAIQQGHELGYTVYLARKLKIPLGSNDPSEILQIREIAKKHGKHLTFLYFMLRTLIYANKKIDREYYFKNSSGYFRHETNWENFNYTYVNFKKVFYRLLKEKFNPKKNYFDYFDPTLDISILNKVSRDLNIIRDNYMLNLIRKILKKYDKIFVIKGLSHLFFEEENIQKIFDRL